MGSHDDGPDALEMALRCANMTPPGTLWAGINSSHGSKELKLLPENVRDPDKREYGDDYNTNSNKTKSSEWYADDDDD